jgi:serine/threonine-protein kinase
LSVVKAFLDRAAGHVPNQEHRRAKPRARLQAHDNTNGEAPDPRQRPSALVTLSSEMSRRRLGVARGHLVQVGLIVALLFSGYFAVWFALLQGYPEDWGQLLFEVLVVIGVCTTLGLSLARVAQNPLMAPHQLSDFGLLILMVLCVVLSIFPVRVGALVGLPPPRMTLTCIAVVAYPLFVPTPFRRLVAVSLLASATQPLALYLFAPRPMPTATLEASILTAALAALTAVLTGRVVEGLRALAREAPLLGAYQLLSRLSRSATTETWTAQHRYLARPAVVKWVQPPNASPSALARAAAQFEREAQIVASLTSPHTVTLFDFGVAERGDFYYVVEHLEGKPLDTYLAQHGPLPPRQALRIALELADSLADAHEGATAHGRLNASRVLLCRIGQRSDFVKVIGFGLAGTLDARGAELGVAARRERAQSDLRAFGDVLDLLLAGRASGEADPPEDPQDAIALEALRAAQRRCTADADPPTAEELHEDLKRAVTASRALGARPGRWTPTAAPPALPRAPEPRKTNGSSAASGSSTRPSFPFGPSRKATRALTEQSTGSTTETGSLPLEQQTLARTRLRQIALVALCLTLGGTLAGWALPEAEWTTADYQRFAVVLGASLALDVGLFAATRSERLSNRAVLRLGLVYAALRAGSFAVATTLLHQTSGIAHPRMTFATLAVVAFPLIVPTPPRRMLPVAVCGAGFQPLAVLVLWRDPIDPAIFVDSLLTASLAVALSYWLTRTARRVHKAAERSRELGAYELLEVIGRGAMGEVWRAQHRLLARAAALKIIRWERQGHDPRAAWRFSREALITASLSSPHTIRLFDYGISQSGTWYYAMELLEGHDLQRLIERWGPLPPHQVVDVGLQICDSLAEAHARGLVHRDLKPSNVFMCRAGRREDFIKVLDFGLARSTEPIEGDGSSVGTGHIVGTPAYMAPEVFLGQRADPRADIYSLGCLLFYLLTGEKVLERPSAIATAIARLNEPAPSAAALAPGAVPEELDLVVARCLARNPGDRYSSALELAAALEALKFAEEVGELFPAASSGDALH